MKSTVSMCALKRGQSGCVCGLCVNGSTRRRLQDIGLVSGTRVTCIQRSPLGDPTAFCIRGAIIALRREDSSKVLVELCD